MVITAKVELPSFNCLETQEVNVSHATLVAAAPFIGKACEGINNEFMLCRNEILNPASCLEIGKAVTACTLEILKQIKGKCLQEFNQYAKCVEKSSGDYSYVPCRNTQAAFDDCMLNKMCMKRPEYGYFTRARIHSTTRAPITKPDPCKPAFPNKIPKLPEQKPECRKPARFTSRHYWVNE